MSSKEAGEVQQYNNGGCSCVALLIRTDVGIEAETNGGTVSIRRDQSWRCRNRRELGLVATHLPEAVAEAV